MKKLTAVVALVMASGVAGAQQAWQKPFFPDNNTTKWSLDGCYRAADTTVVCTFTVGAGGFYYYFNAITLTDKAGRKLNPVWMAVGASGKRITPKDTDHADAQVPPGTSTKLSMAFALAPQYGEINSLTFAYADLANIPVRAPSGATTSYPKSATIPGYTVTFSNCNTNADSTLNCVASLKKIK